MVRNLFEKAHMLQANRLAQLEEITNEDLSTFKIEDIKTAVLR